MKTFRWSTLATHVGVWCGIILFPLLLQIEDESLNSRFMSHLWVMIISIAITFYINYIWVIDRFFYRKKYIHFIAINVVVLLFLHVFQQGAGSFIDQMRNRNKQEVVDARTLEKPERSKLAANDAPPQPEIRPAETPQPEKKQRNRASSGMRSIFFYNELIIFALGVVASLGIKHNSHISEIEEERKRLHSEKLASELTMLKYQMQPHFIFNTLNNIYVLISKSPTNAQKAVHSLSKMMRYILYDNTANYIALTAEVEFLRNYVILMGLRLNDSVKVTYDISENIDGVDIPPLLLIPLLENAYKHGVVTGKQSFIDISLKVIDDKLQFSVTNSFTTLPQEDRSHSGIGLTNLRKRLSILYGNKASFVSGETDESTYTATLSIPINNTKA
ncbi:MAG: histidine kinase [Bacteroidales bacterium]|nr:histidine kinase [Bacteroidales bacterium]